MKLVHRLTVFNLFSLKNQNFLQFFSVSLILLTTFLTSLTQAAIIGSDQRKSSNNIYYPSSAITKLSFTRNGKTSFCTAPMISSRMAVTNSHCLNNSRNLIVTSGIHKAKVIKVLNPSRLDFSFLILSDDIGHEIGWFGLADYKHSFYVNRKLIQLQGYSKDKGFYEESSKCSSRHMYEGISAVFGHDCDTVPGSSGAPLFINKAGKAYIVGLNTASAQSKACGVYSPKNCTNIAITSGVIHKALKSLK